MKSQVMPTSAMSFEDALNDIDVNCNFDITRHPAWDRLLLVNPQKTQEEAPHPHNLNGTCAGVCCNTYPMFCVMRCSY